MRPRALVAVLGAVALALAAPAGADELDAIEREFQEAIQKVTPATVACVPMGIDPRYAGTSSGTILTRRGLVLSDGDAGHYVVPKEGATAERKWATRVEIRVPHLGGRGYDAYEAEVVVRDRELDTSLLRVVDPPSRPLDPLEVGRSDALFVGAFVFTSGTTRFFPPEAPPALSAGVVSSLVSSEDRAQGRFQHLYTSAAVNPGMNGGPVVDVEGRLVGTISSMVQPLENEGDQPYQFLGRVVPIDRLRAFYATKPEAEGLFHDASEHGKARKAPQLERVFHETARRVAPALVSIEIARKSPLQMIIPQGRGIGRLVRHTGPVSGVLASPEGHVVTSLYNLGNTTLLVNRLANAPAEMRLTNDVAGIEKITVHGPGGASSEAKLLGWHEGLGIALLGTDLPAESVTLLAPETGEPGIGTFVLAVADPFGAERRDDPLLTVGVLSKRHPDGIAAPWRGQWQTDAGVTDGNCGGAAVTLRGRLLGILNLWTPARHGRNSGIAFVTPWAAIEAALPAMKEGRSFRRARLGVGWAEGGEARIGAVDDDGPAAAAGVEVGDVVVAAGETRVETPTDLARVLADRWAGDEVVLVVERGGATRELRVTLGTWD